jgi:hypothetical protein
VVEKFKINGVNGGSGGGGGGGTSEQVDQETLQVHLQVKEIMVEMVHKFISKLMVVVVEVVLVLLV